LEKVWKREEERKGEGERKREGEREGDSKMNRGIVVHISKSENLFLPSNSISVSLLMF
jgi:hypothetical protein